jgi:hypothetical protein
MEQLFCNQLEVSKSSGIAPSTLSHHIGVGAIPPPTMGIGRRKFFTKEERDSIITFFEGRRQQRP